MKLFALPTALLVSSAAAATVNIMPFGASIVGAPGCWRAILWRKLQSNNIKNTNFVGSNKAPDCGFPYDGENEGHAGALAEDYANSGALTGYLTNAVKDTPGAKVDVLMMHLGTNDCIQRKETDATIAAYDTLVKQMRAHNPNMKIIVSKLIPIDEKKFAGIQSYINALNGRLDGWKRKLSTDDSPITIVDNASGFNVTTDTTDGEHPNNAGNQKLADKFYPAVSTAIKSVEEEDDDCPLGMVCDLLEGVIGAVKPSA